MFLSKFKRVAKVFSGLAEVISTLGLVFFFSSFTSPALAAGLSSDTYQTLAPITGYIATNVGTNSLTTYLNGMFKLGVAVATGLAVIMIVIGGIQYMSTDAIGGKEEGKEKITGALWGLLIALCAYILLNTINPALLNTDLKVQTAEGDVKNTPKQIGGLDPNAFVRPPQGFIGPGGVYGPGGVQGLTGGNDGIADSYYDDAGNRYINFNNGYTAVLNTDGTQIVYDQNDNILTGVTIDATHISGDTDGRTNPHIDDRRTEDNRPQHQSTTSYAPNGQSLDATTDNYVAVPQNSGIPLGTPVYVIDHNTNQSAWAVVGDYGAVTYGENSLHLNVVLGEASRDRNGNLINAVNNNTGITYTFYPGH